MWLDKHGAIEVCLAELPGTLVADTLGGAGTFGSVLDCVITCGRVIYNYLTQMLIVLCFLPIVFAYITNLYPNQTQILSF